MSRIILAHESPHYLLIISLCIVIGRTFHLRQRNAVPQPQRYKDASEHKEGDAPGCSHSM